MSRLTELTDAALGFIETLLATHAAPAVCWSSGKDSMVLLHLVRRVRPALPVIFFREPWQTARYAFANRLLENWQVAEVHDPPPSESFICNRNGQTSIIHRFGFGQRGLDMPVDLMEMPGQRLVCGLDVMARPKAAYSAPWNLLLTGSKSADADALCGPMPLSAAVVRQAGFPTLGFPLRDWTDADVWEYIEAEAVPYQINRYEKTAEGWREREDKSANPDYVAGCVRCLSDQQPATVACPKHGAQVNNVSRLVPRLEQLLPAYIQP